MQPRTIFYKSRNSVSLHIAQEHIVFVLESLVLKTESRDIKLVYDVLLKAFRNNLRVVVKALREMRVEYKPL